MLSNEIMGYVALWILWGNTLLVALAALKRAGALSRQATRLTRAKGAPSAGSERLFSAAILDHAGPRLAAYLVDQLGRHGAGSARSIRWHDRGARSELGAGIVEAEGKRVRVEAADADVWMGADEVDVAAACPSRAAFEEAYPSAKKTRGIDRELAVELKAGRRAWFFGRLDEKDGALVLAAPAEGRILVSAMDPVVWLVRRARFVQLVFVPGIFAGAAGCTVLALTQPVFESVASKLGGLLGLVFFLVVLPAGTAVRDFLREPSQRFVRGVWEDPAARDAASAMTTAAS